MNQIMHPSASYSITVRLEIRDQPGMLGRVTSALGEEGANIGAIDLVQVGRRVIVRDITVSTCGEAHAHAVVERLRSIPGINVISVSDRTFRAHLGGKIEIHGRYPVRNRDDLAMVYTPGVARVCRAIAEDPGKVYSLTAKSNMVAVVTDGSAVLGLGDIGPEASLPVMEGKCLLFKELGGVNAFPIALKTKDVDTIVETVASIATGFGGINLEDISAPRCFEVESRLQERLDIPVFHDDQHGTAVVVLAGLFNAIRVVGKSLADLKVVISGAGAAGIATARILLSAGIKQVISCDRTGAIYEGRSAGMNPAKELLARDTNPDRLHGSVHEVLRGADVFIGVSSPNLLDLADIQTMAPKPIVFALANPVPEVEPEAVQDHVGVIATGRSDYPNQINNSLAFPGIFRGALDVQARKINEQMKMAAARAIAGTISDDELSEEYIVPSMFNTQVVDRVAEAVANAARRTGVASERKDSLAQLG
ncbi:MAG: NAD-dependent malic enzyme [Dehalococcoidales bacterium]|nr:NAD-dependent malic enzyme [Dehalococcoidales bacterium]